AILLTGCAIGPNYKRPVVAAPRQFRGDATSGQPSQTSLADTKWFDLFQDDVLKQLVQTALDHNYDLGIAAERVLQARAQLGITKADQLPTVNGVAQFSTNKNSRIGANRFLPAGLNPDVTYTQVGFT